MMFFIFLMGACIGALINDFHARKKYKIIADNALELGIRQGAAMARLDQSSFNFNVLVAAFNHASKDLK